MPNQIVLEWEIDVTNTTFGPSNAAFQISQANVPLYENATTDPVLGQLFGLTVASDTTAQPGGSLVTRTLTLNMTAANTPTAPPPFPAHPRTSTPPVLPYPLRTTVPLPEGSFFVSNGSMTVPTTASQIPSLPNGSSIQFLSQQGVFYTVASVGPTSIGLTAPYTGTTSNTGAFREAGAPVTLAAFYSTSDADTNGVATVPAIPAGAGARTVHLVYKDSTGAGPFTVTVPLTGRRPAPVTLAGGSIDIAEIENITIASAGGFGNNVGQITLVSLERAIPAIPANATPGTGIGAGQGTNTFFALTDEAQGLIANALVYLPPSYFALAQHGMTTPQLLGDFSVTTDSANVPTSIDQTSSLAAGNTLQFASQLGTTYTVLAVTPKVVTLTAPFTGIDTNNTGLNNTGTNNNVGTKGNIGTKVLNQLTGAIKISPSPAAVPSNAQLSTPLGQFVALETAQPPLNPPLTPMTVPVPTFLSGFFTRTLQLALAGVQVVSATITFV